MQGALPCSADFRVSLRSFEDDSEHPLVNRAKNAKLPDKRLSGEFFLSLAEARWVIDLWRLDYEHRRSHSSLDRQTPAAFSARCSPSAGAYGLTPEKRWKP